MATQEDIVPQPSTFDFDAHKRLALERFQAIRSQYVEFATVVESVLSEAIRARKLTVASIQSRAKALDSFAAKASEVAADDPTKPKYSDPLQQITDLAGVRVITFFPRTVSEIGALISDEFRVIERTDKSDLLLREERLGYQSVHYLVSLGSNRTSLPEYSRFAPLIAEVQVRTVLQHAWAEIEHDIQYKSVETIPSAIRRRFMALAGLIEIADREFQEIQNEDERLRNVARASVRAGNLGDVEITPDALKAYVDKRLGADGRMTAFSYDWTARLLRRFGFSNFQELDHAIDGYDDDQVSRVVWRSRMGQLTRFETLLLAALGEQYLSHHLWANEPWFPERTRRSLQALQAAGVPIRKNIPLASAAASAGGT